MECPVCLVDKTDFVEFCQSKHKICKKCVPLLPNLICPICRGKVSPQIVCSSCLVRFRTTKLCCEICTEDILYRIDNCRETIKNIETVPKIFMTTDAYRKYIDISEFLKKECPDYLFNMIRTYVFSAHITFEQALCFIQNIFIDKDGLFFTDTQAKLLNTRIWQHEKYYAWRNMLVCLCLDFEKLTVDDFTHGICYYGNLGDKFLGNISFIDYVISSKRVHADKKTFMDAFR